MVFIIVPYYQFPHSFDLKLQRQNTEKECFALVVHVVFEDAESTCMAHKSCPILFFGGYMYNCTLREQNQTYDTLYYE